MNHRVVVATTSTTTTGTSNTTNLDNNNNNDLTTASFDKNKKTFQKWNTTCIVTPQRIAAKTTVRRMFVILMASVALVSTVIVARQSIRAVSYNNNTITNKDNQQGIVQAWMKQYSQEFPFSMTNTPQCANWLQNEQLLTTMARVALHDFYSNVEPTVLLLDNDKNDKDSSKDVEMTSDMTVASRQWLDMMQACHPYPATANNNNSDLQHYLSLRSFTRGMIKAGSTTTIFRGGDPGLFDGEWTCEIWRRYVQTAFTPQRWWQYYRYFFGPRKLKTLRHRQEQMLVETARCAMHLEFPLQLPLSSSSSSSSQQQLLSPKQQPPIRRRPQQIILLTPTMGSQGGIMACKLVATGYPRGWNIVLAQGHYRGLKYKYTYALQALELYLLDAGVNPHDVLVVFADAKDMLIQTRPDIVINNFYQQPYEFVFSAEPNCFPMALWPHSLGIPHHVCHQLFPTASSDGKQQRRKFVNTGGWIGRASAALVVLHELAMTVEQRYPHEQACHVWGTDQLLGNAALLRYYNHHGGLDGHELQYLIGLDANDQVFLGGAWGLVESTFQWSNTTSSSSDSRSSSRISRMNHTTTINNDNRHNNIIHHAYCKTTAGQAEKHCPPLLHFNGGGSEGGSLQRAFERLTSKEALRPYCQSNEQQDHFAGGTVSVVNIDNGSIQTIHDGGKFNREWRNQCFNYIEGSMDCRFP